MRLDQMAGMRHGTVGWAVPVGVGRGKHGNIGHRELLGMGMKRTHAPLPEMAKGRVNSSGARKAYGRDGDGSGSLSVTTTPTIPAASAGMSTPLSFHQTTAQGPQISSLRRMPSELMRAITPLHRKPTTFSPCCSGVVSPTIRFS